MLYRRRAGKSKETMLEADKWEETHPLTSSKKAEV